MMCKLEYVLLDRGFFSVDMVKMLEELFFVPLPP